MMDFDYIKKTEDTKVLLFFLLKKRKRREMLKAPLSISVICKIIIALFMVHFSIMEHINVIKLTLINVSY
jgi:hypothetical protein